MDISSPRQFPRRPLLLTCLHSNLPPPRPSCLPTHIWLVDSMQTFPGHHYKRAFNGPCLWLWELSRGPLVRPPSGTHNSITIIFTVTTPPAPTTLLPQQYPNQCLSSVRTRTPQPRHSLSPALLATTSGVFSSFWSTALGAMPPGTHSPSHTP